MILHLAKHLGWLLFYGCIWAYIFSIKHDGERTIFESGYEYFTEKKYQSDIDELYEKNSSNPLE